jgi:WD40 repeat protein
MGKLGRLSITTHSWKADGSQIIIGAKDGTIEMYNTNGPDPKTWELVYSFKNHSQCVSSVDWHAYGYFLSTSHDRSVLVWNWRENLGKYEA